eukprot:403346926
MPLVFGNTLNDFQITAADQDAEDIVFGGAYDIYPMLGYYYQQNNFHIVKWLNSYETQGVVNTVQSIAFRNQVLFTVLTGDIDVYMTLNPVDGSIVAQQKFTKSAIVGAKSSVIGRSGFIYVCGTSLPGTSGSIMKFDKNLKREWKLTINIDPSYIESIAINDYNQYLYAAGSYQVSAVEKSFAFDDTGVKRQCQGLKSKLDSVTLIYDFNSGSTIGRKLLHFDATYLNFSVSHSTAAIPEFDLQRSYANNYQISSFLFLKNTPYFCGSILAGGLKKAIFSIIEETTQNSQTCYSVFNSPLQVTSTLNMKKIFANQYFGDYILDQSPYLNDANIIIKADLRKYQTLLASQTCYKPTGYRKVKATAGQANNTSTVVTDIQDFTLILGHYTLDDCPDFTGTFEIKIVEGGNPTIERFAQNYSGQYFADFSVTQDDLRPALTLGIQYTLKVQVDFKIGEFLYDRNDEILFNVKIEDCGLYFDETSRPYIPDMNYAINSSTTTSNLVGLTYEPTGCGTIQYLPSLVDEISISSNKINAIYEKPQFETQLQRKQVEVNETLNYQLPSILNPDKILYSVKLMSGSASSFTQIIQLSNKYVFLANPYEVQQVGTHQITIRIKEKLNSQKYIEYNFQLTVVNSNINFYEIEKLKNETIFMQEAGKNRTGYVQARIRQVTNNDLASIGEAMAASIKWTLSTVFGTNIFINILISQSAQYLWGMIEGFQYITHLPLMSVVLPSNTLIYFQFINDIASFNLVDTDGARRLNWRYFRIDIEHNNCNYPTTVSPSIAVPGSTYSKHMHREVLQHEVRFTLRKHPLPKTSGNKSLRQDIYKTKLKRYFENFKCSNDNSKKNSLLVITDDAIPVLYVHKFGLHILRWSLQNFKILQAKKSQEDELVTIFLNIGIRQQSSIESQNVKERQIQE